MENIFSPTIQLLVDIIEGPTWKDRLLGVFLLVTFFACLHFGGTLYVSLP